MKQPYTMTNTCKHIPMITMDDSDDSDTGHLDTPQVARQNALGIGVPMTSL